MNHLIPIAQRARSILTAVVNTRVWTTFIGGMRALTTSIGRPLFTVRTMQRDDVPFIDDYVAMTTEASLDVSTAGTTLPYLAQRGVDLGRTCDNQQLALTEQLSDLEARVSAFEAETTQRIDRWSITTDELFSGQTTRTFSETFGTRDAIDTVSSGYYLDQNFQYVTLGRTITSRNAALGAIITFNFVQDGRVVGFPGSTLEVASVEGADSGTPTVRLTADTGTHADPRALFDDDPNTWFEFERCETLVDQQGRQPLVQQGYAWLYAQSGAPQRIASVIAPDTWQRTMVYNAGADRTHFVVPATGAPYEQVLRLTATIDFQAPTPINEINLTPYVNEQCPATQIGAITITRDDGTTQRFQGAQIGRSVYGESHRGGIELVGPVSRLFHASVRVTRIVLEFLQPFSYETLIGHGFIASYVREDKTSWFGLNNKTRFNVVRSVSPQDVFTIGNSDTTGDTLTAVAGAVMTIPGLQAIGAGIAFIAGIFGSRETTVLETTSGMDVFLARRWSIGLRGIGIYGHQYKHTGVVQTVAYDFGAPITHLKLDLAKEVPPGTYLLVEYSGDGGQWKLMSSDNTVTKMVAPAQHVKLRFTLSRDAEHVYLSPVLHGYTVQGLTL